ncbi:MAG TPA: ATP-binding protein, partial [Planctomycetota bacterium]|nr:ATP-binding protein [Planctomycetota bacterium]
GAITRGLLTKPPRILLYATDGIGKSTFGSRAPDPIFLCAEDGTAGLDVARFPEPRTWLEVLAAVDELTNSDHEYRTLVLDTLDWIEPLIHAHVCQQNGWKDIEAPGYGKGYVAALDQWRILLARLDALRARRGMIIVLLAHSTLRNFKNPDGADFDRYELKLNAKASAVVREWADAVLFANYETLTAKSDGRVRGLSTGARFIYSAWRAAWDAKNRYDLPEQLPLSWSELHAAIAGGSTENLQPLRAEATGLMAQVDPATREKAQAYLDSHPDDPRALAQLVDRLRAKVALTTKPKPSADGADQEISQ